jgi:hypothetical protein
MKTGLSRRDAVGLVALATACPWATAEPSAVPQGIPLAIKGYDPVAYFTDGKPTRGVPEIEYEWDGLRYRFSRADHRELFKADPARYAPQFGNFCAMALSKASWSTPTRRTGCSATASSIFLASRSDRTFSEKTLPETSPRRIRIERSFRRISGRLPGAAS